MIERSTSGENDECLCATAPAPAVPGGSRPERAMAASVAGEAGPVAEPRPVTGGLPVRVLLIEDSPLIRERLAETIAEPGRIEIVGHADSEQAAIGLLASTPWDAMVLDLQLRHGTGLGVLRALVSMRPPGAQVIVLTNYAFPQYRARSLALGADYFLDKAREYHRVREILDDLVRGRIAGLQH